MKKTQTNSILNFKLFFLLFCFLPFFAMAQGVTMQVKTGGNVVYAVPVSGSEKIVFQNPSGGTPTPPSYVVLIVHPAGGAPVETSLDDIKEVTLSDGNLSVVPFSGTPVVYALADVEKLTFGPPLGINQPKATEINVLAYFNRSGNVVVKCEAGIRSLTLFGIDGRMLVNEKCNGETTVETQHATSLPTGIYLVRIETPHGIVGKKIVKP
jgi:hypothetical protein